MMLSQRRFVVSLRLISGLHPWFGHCLVPSPTGLVSSLALVPCVVMREVGFSSSLDSQICSLLVGVLYVKFFEYLFSKNLPEPSSARIILLTVLKSIL